MIISFFIDEEDISVDIGHARRMSITQRYICKGYVPIYTELLNYMHIGK